MKEPQKSSSEEAKTVELEPVPVASAEALEAMERAQISELVATAKKYRRNIDHAIEKAIRRATVNQDIAEGCHYWLPRTEDGEQKWITGPSIKLAKIMAQSWGNCRHGAMVIGVEGDFLKVQAFFYDCEENHLAVEQVARQIVTRRGVRYGANMVQTTAAAAGSIALRKAILDVIPEEYVDKVGAAAKKVAYGEEKPLVERRQRAIERFAKLDVDRDAILRFLARDSVTLITREDLEKLLGVYTSLSEGLVKKEEIFTKPAPPSVPTAKLEEPPQTPDVEAAKAHLSDTQKRIKKASARAQEEQTGASVPAAKTGEKAEFPF